MRCRSRSRRELPPPVSREGRLHFSPGQPGRPDEHHVVAADEVDAVFDGPRGVVRAHLHEMADESLVADEVEVRREDDPRALQAQNIASGAGMAPGRGDMPWNSGFEGFQQNVLQELLRALQMRQMQQARAAQKNALPPVKGGFR